jgi:DNA modification methylase
MKIAFKTDRGISYLGSIEDFIRLSKFDKYKGKINLIFTSPPFPLNRKKAYGNLVGDKYLAWLTNIFVRLTDFLADDGSIVIELGNAWNKGEPTMSTLPLKALLNIQETANLHLCQSFIWQNPAKLPSPAQWVNIDRIRVKDSYTNIWWLSKIPNPKADNRNVLTEYSESMKHLFKKGKYNSGARPSEHVISEQSFLISNGGAIPGSVITASNTKSNSRYIRHCKEKGIKLHPARMPESLVEFFLNLLTDENDLVLDPFGGSNTTGYVSENQNRRWISTELNSNYIFGSLGRFDNIKQHIFHG